jgi:hypothetical protein
MDVLFGTGIRITQRAIPRSTKTTTTTTTTTTTQFEKAVVCAVKQDLKNAHLKNTHYSPDSFLQALQSDPTKDITLFLGEDSETVLCFKPQWENDLQGSPNIIDAMMKTA